MGIFTVNNFIIFLGFIAFCYPFYQAYKDKKIGFIDVLFMFAGIGIMLLAIVHESQIKAENKESKRISDSIHTVDTTRLLQADSITRKNILDTLGIGNRNLNDIRKLLDSINKKNNLSAIPKEENPILGISANPDLKENGKGGYELNFTLKSINSSDVYYPRNSLIGFTMQSGTIVGISRFLKSVSNEGSFFSKSLPDIEYLYIIRSTVMKTDTMYFYFKVLYQDRLGKEQHPLRVIYYNVNYAKETFPVDDEKFKLIKAKLISKRLW